MGKGGKTKKLEILISEKAANSFNFNRFLGFI